MKNKKAQAGLGFIIMAIVVVLFGTSMLLESANQVASTTLSDVNLNESTLLNFNESFSLSQTPHTSFNAQVYNQTWLNFDGQNDYANVPNSQNINPRKEVTLETKIYMNDIGTKQGILGLSNTSTTFVYGLYVESTLLKSGIKNISASFSNGNPNYNISALNNTWIYVTLTYNGSNASLYLNGQSVKSSTSISGELASSSHAFGAGRWGGLNNNYFNGSIEYFKVYNYSLTPQEVENHYLIAKGGIENNIYIPEITFHRIENNCELVYFNNYTCVTPENFTAFMNYLEVEHFTPISYYDFYNARNNNFNYPAKPIIIVFDDIGTSQLTNASSILESKGWKAGLAVPSNFTKATDDRMNWSQIQTLYNLNWSIYSHSINHNAFVDMSTEDRLLEFNESRYNIAGNLTGLNPQDIKIFIFPENNLNQTILDECYRFYDVCIGRGRTPETAFEYIYPKMNITSLTQWRIGIRSNTTLQQFQKAVNINYQSVLNSKLNENQNTIIYDSSFGNNGSLVNSPSWANDNAILTLNEKQYIRNGQTFILNNDWLSNDYLSLLYNYEVKTETTNSKILDLTILAGALIILSFFAYYLIRELL